MKFIPKILFYFFVSVTCLGGISKKVHLSQVTEVPHAERCLLEKFFQVLVKQDGLGYVLFGDKPVCLSGYFIQTPLGNMLRGSSSNVYLKKGWMVWEKYAHLFSHPNFLIFKEDHVRGDKNICALVFINKKNLVKVLLENKALFQKELHTIFDPEQFVRDITDKQSLSEAINSHEGLLGVLLGYGVESSMKYYERDLMWKSKLPLKHREIYLQPVPSQSSLEMQFICQDINPICFVADPESQEAKAILDKKAKERDSLLQIYSGGEFLTTTLKKLMES